MSTAVQRRRRYQRRHYGLASRVRRWWYRNGDTTLEGMGMGILTATGITVIALAMWAVYEINQYHP